jgi:hypothetical protein
MRGGLDALQQRLDRQSRRSRCRKDGQKAAADQEINTIFNYRRALEVMSSEAHAADKTGPPKYDPEVDGLMYTFFSWTFAEEE